MNGATTEPLVNTINPPKRAMTMKTGNSQNFLRTRRKPQNSRRNPTISTSELVPERLRGGARRIAHDPVGSRRGIALRLHRILAGKPHQKPDRRDAAVEQESK